VPLLHLLQQAKKKGRKSAFGGERRCKNTLPLSSKANAERQGQMLLLLLRCVGDQIFSTAASATVGVAKQQMHISFCIALLDLV
jgi:hypothetical protein